MRVPGPCDPPPPRGGLLYPWRLILQAPFKAAKGKLDAMPSKGHIKNNDLNGTIIYNPANATNP